MGIEATDDLITKATQIKQWDKTAFLKGMAEGSVDETVVNQYKAISKAGYGNNMKAQEALVVASWRLAGFGHATFTRMKVIKEGKEKNKITEAVVWEEMCTIMGGEHKAKKALEEGRICAIKDSGFTYYARRILRVNQYLNVGEEERVGERTDGKKGCEDQWNKMIEALSQDMHIIRLLFVLMLEH